MTISLQRVTRRNWRDTLQLRVHPDQQRFVADHAPIAAIALAKAFVRPGGLVLGAVRYLRQHGNRGII